MPIDELLNLYDASGSVVGARPRNEAQQEGFAAGAVQLLLVGGDGRVLLQKRRADKENGGLWDKSVGGHVLAGESFDEALVREANEELFGSANAGRVACLDATEGLAAVVDSGRVPVVVSPVRTELNLRDVRFASSETGEIINVRYHAAQYLGATRLPLNAFAPQEEELAGLDWFEFDAVDRMLTRGELAPNMTFLWFALGHRAAVLARALRDVATSTIEEEKPS